MEGGTRLSRGADVKNIAIFCDGTWQTFDQWFPTNVARLARATLPAGKAGAVQVIYYDDGVGVPHGVARLPTEVLGGAFGDGLDDKILQAYKFLCLNYNPGDHVYLFGFSRGAYTARCLAGLIHREWIVRREKLNLVEGAMQDYRSLTRSPVQLHSYIAQNCWPLPPQSDGGIAYLGVWDTVGALGIPDDFPFSHMIDVGREFHDLDLSSFVKSARHAVSIDEHRKAFVPTLWSNLDALSAADKAVKKKYSEFAYQQIWFPGGHGSVGGGGPDVGISATPLLWIAEGAARAGLEFDQAMLSEFAKERNDLAEFPPDGTDFASRMIDVEGAIERTPGPRNMDEVSEAAVKRWRGRTDYRPPQLARLLN
jgi:uncharacterized protein (DUF2235 family)